MSRKPPPHFDALLFHDCRLARLDFSNWESHIELVFFLHENARKPQRQFGIIRADEVLFFAFERDWIGPLSRWPFVFNVNVWTDSDIAANLRDRINEQFTTDRGPVFHLSLEMMSFQNPQILPKKFPGIEVACRNWSLDFAGAVAGLDSRGMASLEQIPGR